MYVCTVKINRKIKMILDHFLNEKNKVAPNENLSGKSSDKAMRSVVKSVSWRVIGTLDTIVISWLITGEVSMALTIGSVELITKMVLYFFHERIWNIIKWGRQ